jgi:hypothetical protein
MSIEKLKAIHRKLWGFGYEMKPTTRQLQNVADELSEAISELQNEGDGWISVKDRLPDLGVQVLAYGDHADCDGGKAFYAAKYTNDFWGFAIPGIGGLKITHWKPLPSPPKQQ